MHLRRVVDGLRAARDEVLLFSAGPERTGLGKALDIWHPGERRRLAAVARRWAPDLIHFHNVARELSAAVLGAARGAPRVMTFHDHRLLGSPDVLHQPPARARLIRAKCVADRLVARRALDAAIALSDDTEALLARYGFRHVHRLDQFAPRPAKRPERSAGECDDIVFAGRLSVDKGIGVLAEAFTRIAPRHPRSRLVVAGDGPERPMLDDLSRSLPGRVVVLGRVEEQEVSAAMARARVVAAPSIQALRAETGPQTVIEAALLGRPVITCAGVPLAQLVVESGGGRVVAPGSVGELARALDEICADPTTASREGAAACERATVRHTAEVAIPELRATYRQVAARGGHRTLP